MNRSSFLKNMGLLSSGLVLHRFSFAAAGAEFPQVRVPLDQRNFKSKAVEAAIQAFQSFMRQGLSPEAACRKAVERIVKKNPAKAKANQVGFIAINKQGQFGGFCLQSGFSYAVCFADDKNFIVQGKHWF